MSGSTIFVLGDVHNHPWAHSPLSREDFATLAFRVTRVRGPEGISNYVRVVYTADCQRYMFVPARRQLHKFDAVAGQWEIIAEAIDELGTLRLLPGKVF